MRAYERSGVLVDQCGECRGIFLDRGELERLMDAEAAAGAAGAAAPTRGSGTPAIGPESDARDRDRGRGRDEDRREHDDEDDASRRRDPRGGSVGPDGRRRESRFGGILDIFGGD
jgi:Zn-finger nucleic acid-binding protein